jgi:hypothetical protein
VAELLLHELDIEPGGQGVGGSAVTKALEADRGSPASNASRQNRSLTVFGCSGELLPAILAGNTRRVVRF